MSDYCDCRNTKHLFIMSGSQVGTDDAGREYVWLCANCGKFHVLAIRGGQHFDLTFQLVTDEQVRAAGRYAALLQREEMYGTPEYNKAVGEAEQRYGEQRGFGKLTPPAGPAQPDGSAAG